MSLISTDFAEKNLKEFKIIDASWHLPTENRDPYLEYKESHIPNSVFFDLDNTSVFFSDVLSVEKNGVRNMTLLIF